jgi:hypothetical protein
MLAVLIMNEVMSVSITVGEDEVSEVEIVVEATDTTEILLREDSYIPDSEDQGEITIRQENNSGLTESLLPDTSASEKEEE